jgi:putative membrane protein
MTASYPAPSPAPPAPETAGPFRGLPAELAPHRTLLTYYSLKSLLAGPGVLFLLPFLYFRYRTLRYVVDEEGITMRWGILFRREISLTFSRIQDIHLSSNVVERWLGLAKIQVQTASGSSSAEMTIEGLPQFEAMRDFLYSRMRGARDRAQSPAHIPAAPAAGALPSGSLGELTEVLREVAAEVRELRAALPAAVNAEARDA